MVTWDDALAYCRWLSEQTGRSYRLPTEAEWEYACRAGTATAFHFGMTITTDQANYDGKFRYGQCPKDRYREQTVPVGSLPANPWGLCEMHCNVCEWCQDWFGDYEAVPQAAPPGVQGFSLGGPPRLKPRTPGLPQPLALCLRSA